MAEEKKKKDRSKWFREMRSELKKVVWPTASTTAKNTGTVPVSYTHLDVYKRQDEARLVPCDRRHRGGGGVHAAGVRLLYVPHRQLDHDVGLSLIHIWDSSTATAISP